MSSLVDRVEQVILNKRLLGSGGRLVVAVSAGPDSVCLLRALHQLAPRYGWELIVAHLNHGFRGVAARADAAFVQRLAARLGWPFRQETVNIPALLAARGGSPQEVSRNERYRFLRQVACSEQARAIVLAHHQGDQAETVLQHLLRGAGSSGLGGMRALEAGDPCPLVRPLLGESRMSIMRYLQSIGQSFRVDQSNAEDHYQRNLLRWETLPLLSRFNGEIEAALSRTADLLQAEDLLLSELAQEAYLRVRRGGSPVLSLDLGQLQRLPLALARRVMRLAWCEVSASERDLQYSHVEEALALLSAPVGAACNWPRGFVCERSYQDLLVRDAGQPSSAFRLVLNVPGSVTLPRRLGIIRASVLSRPFRALDFGSPNRVYCDRNALGAAQLVVRSWLPGDEFWPFGLAGRKKLQDFFVDCKIPRHERGDIPLVEADGQLVWVAGKRLAEPFRVTACSREIVCLEYIHSEE